MREFIPSDYIDKEGNVYETVGENIREGKNGSVTSDFPTPEEIGNGLVGSDGKNYTAVLKNLGDTSKIIDSAYVIRSHNGILSYELPISILSENNKVTTPPSAKGVLEYIGGKIPNTDLNYSWVTVNVTYNGTDYSIDNPLFNISKDGIISSDKNVVDLFPISTNDAPTKIVGIEKGFSGTSKNIIGWDIKCSYTAKILVEG